MNNMRKSRLVGTIDKMRRRSPSLWSSTMDVIDIYQRSTDIAFGQCQATTVTDIQKGEKTQLISMIIENTVRRFVLGSH
jgi:hypothetical protein